MHITVSDKQYEALVAEAIRVRRSQAEITRTALDEHLKRNERRTLRGFEVAIFVRRLPRVFRRIYPRLTD
jgi:hypothetical protein